MAHGVKVGEKLFIEKRQNSSERHKREAYPRDGFRRGPKIYV
jgi:hypothetical protein